MDQLTAFQILGLEPVSTLEEIKEAYATLSKRYHPEEEPEKFQEIHEAYVTLTRRKKRGNVQNVYQDDEPTGTIDFKNVEIHETEQIPQYDFENAEEKARIQADEKLHELVLEASAELKVLVSPKYKNSLKAYKALFEDKKYEAIIRKTEFLEKLCFVLEETKLQKHIYNYIIEFYRLRGMKPGDLSPIGKRLYQVLDEKVGIKQKVHPGVYGGVAASIIFIFRAVRPIIRQNETLATIVLCAFAVFLLVWIFKKLRERWSALIGQIVVAIILALSQFIVLMFDAYGTAFGSVEAGNDVAVIVFMLALAWLFVLIIVGCIKVIIKAIVGTVKKVNR